MQTHIAPQKLAENSSMIAAGEAACRGSRCNWGCAGESPPGLPAQQAPAAYGWPCSPRDGANPTPAGGSPWLLYTPLSTVCWTTCLYSTTEWYNDIDNSIAVWQHCGGFGWLSSLVVMLCWHERTGQKRWAQQKAARCGSCQCCQRATFAEALASLIFLHAALVI